MYRWKRSWYFVSIGWMSLPPRRLLDVVGAAEDDREEQEAGDLAWAEEVVAAPR